MKTTWDGISPGETGKEKGSGLFERLQKSAAQKSPVGNPAPAGPVGGAEDGTPQDRGPIEPGGGWKAFGVLRLIIFIAAMLWVVASVYRDPMLAAAGRYLIVSHPVEKADLVVCLAGSPVDGGLEAAELVKEGYASRVFIPREEPPEAIGVLKARGVDYPETRELIFDMLAGLDLPPETLTSSDIPAGGIAEEAELLRNVAASEGYTRLIVVASPQHTRRAWIAFRHMFKDTGVTIIMRPARFSGFQPEDWWKKRRYTRDVILEYMKTAWYLWAL